MKTLDDLQLAISSRVIGSVTLSVAVNKKCMASCTHGPQHNLAHKWGDTLEEAITGLMADLDLITEVSPIVEDDEDDLL